MHITQVMFISHMACSLICLVALTVCNSNSLLRGKHDLSLSGEMVHLRNAKTDLIISISDVDAIAVSCVMITASVRLHAGMQIFRSLYCHTSIQAWTQW